MAITALFGFWGYWCPYLQLNLLGYLGFFHPHLHPVPDHCSRWGCIMIDYTFFAEFGPASSLGALASPSLRPPSWTT